MWHRFSNAKGCGKNRRVGPTSPLRLGELEIAVMDHLWSRGPTDVNAVHGALGKRRGIRPNTVQSAMARLHQKGLLRRRKVSHAYVYEPSWSRRELAVRVIEEVVSKVLRRDADAMLAVIVDLADRAGRKQLDRLASLLAERRAASRHPE